MQINKAGPKGLMMWVIKLTLKQCPSRPSWFFPLVLVSWSPALLSDHPTTPNQHWEADGPGGKSRGNRGSVVGKRPSGPSVTVTAPYVSQSENSRLPQSSSLFLPMLLPEELEPGLALAGDGRCGETAASKCSPQLPKAPWRWGEAGVGLAGHCFESGIDPSPCRCS